MKTGKLLIVLSVLVIIVPVYAGSALDDAFAQYKGSENLTSMHNVARSFG
jgi:hypothetical protein